MKLSTYVNLSEAEIIQIKELVAVYAELHLSDLNVSLFKKLTNAEIEINQMKDISNQIKHKILNTEK